MAIDFDGSDDYLSLYSLTQPGGDPFTVMMWVYSDVVFTGGYLGVGTKENAAGSHRVSFYTGETGNPNNLSIRINGSGTEYHYGAITLSSQTWFHLAVSRNDTAIKTYIDGVLDVDITHGMTLESTPNPYLAKAFSGAWNGRMAAFKHWDSDLTIGEVQQELYFFLPIKSDPTMWTPFVADETTFRDYSGTATSDWSSEGTAPSFGPGPPITWRKGASKIFVPAGAAPPAGGANFFPLLGVG